MKTTYKRTHCGSRFWARASQGSTRGLWIGGKTRDEADRNALADLRREQAHGLGR